MATGSNTPEDTLPGWCRRWFTCILVVSGLLTAVALYTKHSFVCALLPMACIVELLVTVGLCYILIRPKLKGTSIVLPYVSELGMWFPEKWAYQLGFSMCSIMILATLHIFERKIAPHLLISVRGTDDELLVYEAIKSGYYMSFGVALQGVCTLGIGVSVETVMHLLGALIFSVFGMTHCGTVRQLFQTGLSANQEIGFFAHPLTKISINTRELCLNRFPLLFILMPILFQSYQVLLKSGQAFGEKPNPGAGETNNDNPPVEENSNLRNIIALMQWLVVLQSAIYFCTYSIDFWVSDHVPSVSMEIVP